MEQSADHPLGADHTPAAVRRRFAAQPRVSYLPDFVYGAIDGAVTLSRAWPASGRGPQREQGFHADDLERIRDVIT